MLSTPNLLMRTAVPSPIKQVSVTFGEKTGNEVYNVKPDTTEPLDVAPAKDPFAVYVFNKMKEVDSDWWTFDKKGVWAEAVHNTLLKMDLRSSPFATELKQWIDENPQAKYKNLANKLIEMLSEKVSLK
ncbi:MAG: hypothetical protein AB7V50_09785 [Vampirovibrionia bacterium]